MSAIATIRECSICGEESRHFLSNNGDLVCFDCFDSVSRPSSIFSRFVEKVLSEQRAGFFPLRQFCSCSACRRFRGELEEDKS